MAAAQEDDGEADDAEADGGKGLEGTISRLGTGLTQLVGGQKESTATVAERQVSTGTRAHLHAHTHTQLVQVQPGGELLWLVTLVTWVGHSVPSACM